MPDRDTRMAELAAYFASVQRAYEGFVANVRCKP